jgi:hypothetical protein
VGTKDFVGREIRGHGGVVGVDNDVVLEEGFIVIAA